MDDEVHSDIKVEYRDGHADDSAGTEMVRSRPTKLSLSKHRFWNNNRYKRSEVMKSCNYFIGHLWPVSFRTACSNDTE